MPNSRYVLGCTLCGQDLIGHPEKRAMELCGERRSPIKTKFVGSRDPEVGAVEPDGGRRWGRRRQGR
jgi:hypothetical protein